MCNSCWCENQDLCSVRGTAPMGWCCHNCSVFSPLSLPCPNQFETYKTREFIILRDLIMSDEVL